MKREFKNYFVSTRHKPIKWGLEVISIAIVGEDPFPYFYAEGIEWNSSSADKGIVNGLKFFKVKPTPNTFNEKEDGSIDCYGSNEYIANKILDFIGFDTESLIKLHKTYLKSSGQYKDGRYHLDSKRVLDQKDLINDLRPFLSFPKFWGYDCWNDISILRWLLRDIDTPKEIYRKTYDLKGWRDMSLLPEQIYPAHPIENNSLNSAHAYRKFFYKLINLHS